MKFKAVLDHTGLQTFLAVAHCMNKVSDECALHLTEEAFQFRKKPDANTEVEVYASLTAELFCEHTIRSKADNTISLLVGMKNLLHAFNSADHGETTVIKLTRRGTVPCLTIIADTPSGLNVTQDVPIKRLLSRDGMEDYKEPMLGNPTAFCGFPETRQVRTCLERMQSLDKYVYVEFNADKSQLVFRVQTPVVCVRQNFSGLNVTVEKTRARADSQRLVCCVQVSDFLSVVNFASVNNIDECVLACVENQALVLHVNFEDSVGSMTHYVPLVDPEDIMET